LGFPAACYTQASLRAAGKRFKWFPCFAELNEFLPTQLEPLHCRRWRLARIASYAPVTPPMTEAERRDIAAQFAELKASLPADTRARGKLRPITSAINDALRAACDQARAEVMKSGSEGERAGEG